MKTRPRPNDNVSHIREVIAISATVVVLGLGFLSFFSVQRGPVWGVTLQHQGNEVVASWIQDNGLADNQNIVSGVRILQVDSADPNLFVDRSLSTVSRIVWQDPVGAIHEAQTPNPSLTLFFVLLLVGLIFASLGGMVYRWAPDSVIRVTFLVFGVSVAVVLVTSPAASVGYAWASALTGLGSVVAGTSFALFGAAFPHPSRFFRPISVTLIGFATPLAVTLTWLILSNSPFSSLFDTSFWSYFVVTLVVALSFLTARTIGATTRSRLVPVAIGCAVGIAPVIFLSAVPYLLTGHYLVRTEYSAAAAVAVPIGITYAIVRHHLFGLDALVRRFLIGLAEVGSVALLVGVGWVAVEASADNALVLIAVALLLGITIPILTPRVSLAVDVVLYPSVTRARRGADLTRLSGLPEIGSRMARLAREVVPVQWSLVVLRGNRASDSLDRSGHGRGRILASDGDVPPLVPNAITWDQSMPRVRELDPAAYTVTPIISDGIVFGALLVGARLDGSRVGSIDLEALRIFVDRSVMPIEAALLREQADEEERYRAGLARFARALAMAGAVRDVLELTAQYARDLLEATSSRLWERSGDGVAAPVTTAGDEAFLPPSPVYPADLGSAEPVQVFLTDDRLAVEFHLRGTAVSETVGVVVRADESGPFGPRDTGRLAEVVEYTSGALGRAQAVSAAAEAETLREINRVRTEIFDMVSHDLQSPLTVVRGYAELLQIRGTGDAFVDESAEAILNAYRSCQNLIDDLLTSSRLDKGKLSLNLENLDVADILRGLVAAFRVLPGGDRLGVEAESGALVKADRTRVEQMVANLISNALRYAPGGPVLVRGYRTSTEVVIEVRDRGPGIAPAELPRIWEKFYRAGTGHAAPRGTGVGLSVVRTLAELHGGRADVESVLGEGTTFRLTFPAAGRVVRHRDGGFERPLEFATGEPRSTPTRPGPDEAVSADEEHPVPTR